MSKWRPEGFYDILKASSVGEWGHHVKTEMPFAEFVADAMLEALRKMGEPVFTNEVDAEFGRTVTVYQGKTRVFIPDDPPETAMGLTAEEYIRRGLRKPNG